MPTQTSVPAQPSVPAPSAPPTASVNAVTINWIPPTENVDGTALTNLAGYNIHYGTASRNYTQVIPVSKSAR